MPVELIGPNPRQPRRNFDESALASLAASLKSTGLIQPIIVRRMEGRYQLIAGERRWRAAQLADLETIPAIIRDVDASAQAEMALVENTQRVDLNPIERAEAYQGLIDSLGLTQNELATRVSEDRSAIANHLRLLTLDAQVRTLIAAGTVSLGHAKVLAGVEDVDRQRNLADRVFKEEMSVRDLEKAVKAELGPAAPKPAPPNAHQKDLETSLSHQLGLRVQLRGAARKKGQLVIHYSSLQEFDDLINRMGIQIDPS